MDKVRLGLSKVEELRARYPGYADVVLLTAASVPVLLATKSLCGCLFGSREPQSKSAKKKKARKAETEKPIDNQVSSSTGVAKQVSSSNGGKKNTTEPEKRAQTSGKPLVPLSAAEQADLKDKRREIEKLRVAAKERALNNRDRRTLKKLERDVEILLDPSVMTEQERQEREKDKATHAGGNGAPKNSKETPSSEPANARVIDLQNKFGLSMEQSHSAMVAAQLQQSAGGSPVDTMTRRKKKAVDEDGWETVKTKKR